MPIEVTARHMHATDQIQEYARRKAEAIVDAFPKVEHVHVILDVIKHQHIAKVFVQSKNHLRAEAEEASAMLVTSIDAAADKIEKQLRRVRDRIHDHKPAMKHGEVGRERGISL
jgi:putative sigma-54 modulation protein